MSATTPHPTGKPDVDELVQQLDYLTTDMHRISHTLDRIRVATTITAIASALTIIGFVFALVLGLAGAFAAAS